MRGQKRAAQGRLDEALEALAQARVLRPGAAGMALHQALVLSEAARLPEAVAALQQAIALQPTNPVLPMFLGRIYFDHADYAQAAQWCDRASALQPRNHHLLALQALIGLASGQVPQGYQRLQQPISLPGVGLERGLMWLSRSRVPSLLQQANTALQSRVLLQAEMFLAQHPAATRTLAQQLLEHAAAHEGETLADRLLTRLDRGVTWGVLRLQTLCAMLRFAFQPTRRALQLRLLQAEEAASRGQAADAQALYTAVVQQEPELPYVQERLCEVYYAQGKFREALHHLRRVLRQRPDPEQAGAEHCVLLGELLCQLGQYQEADRVLARGVTGPRRDYRLFYYLGLCQVHADAPQAARRHFAQAVQRLHPDIVTLRLAEMYRVYQQRAGAMS
jgi:tetratricopeptide (TPR) repeat protein